jgi:pantetheine-phosphate adenylyltransferase
VRIVAGQWRGRRLEGPRGAGVRPTSDRLRETLFNVLGPNVAGARVVDAYAGTGALGLEALSRGAAAATFVERDARALAVLARNIAAVGAGNACRIIRGDFLRVALPSATFDLVLLDPPYDVDDLRSIVDRGAALVSAGGRLVLEHSRRRESPPDAGGFPRVRVLRAGDSALSFYAGAPPVADRPLRSSSMRTAVFPGTFDPLTTGHVDIVERAAQLFDRVIVAVLVNPSKQPMFSLAERVAMVHDTFAGREAIEVDSFHGLLVEFARRRGAAAIVRGVRSAGDFDYERQMTLMNRHLAPQIDTIFLASSPAVSHVSATLVREIASLGGPIADLVPPAVLPHVERRRPSATVKA